MYVQQMGRSSLQYRIFVIIHLLALQSLLQSSVFAQRSIDDLIRVFRNTEEFQGKSERAVQFESATENATENLKGDSLLQFGGHTADILSDSIFQLAHDIGVESGKVYKGKAQIFSPLSISAALALLFLGSNGHTYDEFGKVFGYKPDPAVQARLSKIHYDFASLISNFMATEQMGTDANTVEIVNGLFISNAFSVRPTYKLALENIYKTSVESVDFSKSDATIRNQINIWTAQRTHGKISKIASHEIHTKMQIIVANSLYFVGFWKYAFPEKLTQKSTFYPEGVQKPGISVQMMENLALLPYYRSKEYDCQIVGLPYDGDKMRMYVILPNKSNRQKLHRLQKILDAKKLTDLLMKTKNQLVSIQIPKMNTFTTINLKETLKKIGIKSAFDKTRSDLSVLSSGLAQGDSEIFSWIDMQSDDPEEPDTSSNKEYNTKTDDVSIVQMLDAMRNAALDNPGLHVDDFVHKINFGLYETGTENLGISVNATFTSSALLTKMVQVNVPFLILVHHELLQVPILYGAVYEPEMALIEF